MDSVTTIGQISIIIAGATMAVGAIGPSIGEAWVAARAMSAIAQQPDEAATITRTLFVSLAIIESVAIYCFVISMVVIFANPFWAQVLSTAK
jgi:F-type H+-transporting ATPase subunit c